MNLIFIYGGLLFSWVSKGEGWSLRKRGVAQPYQPPVYEDDGGPEDDQIFQNLVQESDNQSEVVITEPLTTIATPTTTTTTTKDPFALHAAARQNAIHVIFEKMFIALGPDFPAENRLIPSNETIPTVVTPLNITTDPCPDVYAKCSSEIFFPSCNSPRNSNPLLWKRRFNLFFDLPKDLLTTDELLNATLRLYKNDVLPLSEPSEITVEVHRYIKSLTKKRDVHLKINSTKVMSDTIGWVTIDVIDLIRNLKPKKNHGLLIKVKDSEDIPWLEPRLFVPMDCSSDNISVLPLPFGVETDQPEQKFPSLHIRTGRPDLYYPANPIEFDTLEPTESKGIIPQDNVNIQDESMLNLYQFSRNSKSQFYPGNNPNHFYADEEQESLYDHKNHDTTIHKKLKSPRDGQMSSDDPSVDKLSNGNQAVAANHHSNQKHHSSEPLNASSQRVSLSQNENNPSQKRASAAHQGKRQSKDLSNLNELEMEDEEEGIPYSSIEISIHSNGWNKPLWALEDILDKPRRHQTSRRRRRHRQQHNKGNRGGRHEAQSQTATRRERGHSHSRS